MTDQKTGIQETAGSPEAPHKAGAYRVDSSRPIQYTQVENDRWSTKDAEVITETPVSLTVNGEVWLTFMCTPVDLEALALGFLFNEGLLKSMDEVAQVHTCAAGDNVDVWLHHPVDRPDKWRRTSGCTGGMTSVDSDPLPENDTLLLERPTSFSSNGVVLTALQVNHLVETLFDSQDLYRRTGGVHTSILTDGHEVYAVGEDIGRHNTLDKLSGRCLLENIELPGRIIITTGRISSEMIQKAARLGASVVISRTSPSSLSVRLAERWGITLIGYARRNRFNLYTHPERILLES